MYSTDWSVRSSSVPLCAPCSRADHCIQKYRCHQCNTISIAESCTLQSASISPAGGGNFGLWKVFFLVVFEVSYNSLRCFFSLLCQPLHSRSCFIFLLIKIRTGIIKLSQRDTFWTWVRDLWVTKPQIEHRCRKIFWYVWFTVIQLFGFIFLGENVHSELCTDKTEVCVSEIQSVFCEYKQADSSTKLAVGAVGTNLPPLQYKWGCRVLAHDE